MRLVGERSVRISTVGNVAVRRGFYVRTRPNGEEIHDNEWSMSHSERAVTPILREIELRWPLSERDKATLAEFAALQLLRSPRFRTWHEEFIDQTVDEMRTEDGLRALSEEVASLVAVHHVDRVGAHLKQDTQRHIRMLSLLSKVGSIFGSMHWTLVKFDRPVVATSDHPVHVWPMERSTSRPLPGRMGAGVLQALEVRFPITSALAIVMSWLPEPDALSPVRGARHHAKNLNAFTVSEAEKAWFFLPGTSPPVGTGTFLPISADLLSNYDVAAALESPVRVEVSRRTQPKIGEDLQASTELEMVRVSRPSG